MASVGGDEAGTGASVNSTLRQVGGALAAALGSAVSRLHQALHPFLAALLAGDAAIASGSITQAFRPHRRAPRHGRR